MKVKKRNDLVMIFTPVHKLLMSGSSSLRLFWPVFSTISAGLSVEETEQGPCFFMVFVVASARHDQTSRMVRERSSFRQGL